jgi:hypothetical protein
MILGAATVLSFLFLFIYSNYKMFKIAKSKREDERVVSTIATSVDENRKERIFNLKNNSTCSLTVGCFFVCFSPYIIYITSRLVSETPSYERQVKLFSVWSNTFISTRKYMHAETLALLTKPLYFPNMKYLK